jgi:hypothetical protein
VDVSNVTPAQAKRGGLDYDGNSDVDGIKVRGLAQKARFTRAYSEE